MCFEGATCTATTIQGPSNPANASHLQLPAPNHNHNRIPYPAPTVLLTTIHSLHNHLNITESHSNHGASSIASGTSQHSSRRCQATNIWQAKLKVQLKLSISRLRMVQQKDSAKAKQQRRDMAQLLEVHPSMVPSSTAYSRQLTTCF